MAQLVLVHTTVMLWKRRVMQALNVYTMLPPIKVGEWVLELIVFTLSSTMSSKSTIRCRSVLLLPSVKIVLFGNGLRATVLTQQQPRHRLQPEPGRGPQLAKPLAGGDV